MGKTKIEWTEYSWNPSRGCSPASPGCAHCYAARMAARFCGDGMDEDDPAYDPCAPFHRFVENGHWTGRVELIEGKLHEPLHWCKPRRIFVNSMSDTFHEALSDESIDRIFAVMSLCPQHTFMVLTKRAERMRKYFTDGGNGLCRVRILMEQPGWINLPVGRSFPRWPSAWPLPNVWLGVSAEDQKHKDRIDVLRETPVALRFLSLEPLLENLGPLDLRGVGWVIAGCESGLHRRKAEAQWFRDIRNQCSAAGVPFFLKQMEVDRRIVKLPALDGKVWSEFPEVSLCPQP